MASPDDRIRATYLIDMLDAAIESLPPEARPGPHVDPGSCAHPVLFQFEHAPEPRRWYCEVCGARVPDPGGEAAREAPPNDLQGLGGVPK